jgi:hypothetical protein
MTVSGAYGVCIVISDPDPQGGFPAGAKLQGVAPMLAQGTFTPGSVILFQGRRQIVLGAPGSKQTLAVRR